MIEVIPNEHIRKVIILEYNSEWPQKFIKESEKIIKLLGEELVYIEHIGSTSIPNMAAKPVIDILISVKDINHIDTFNKQFEELGYTPKGEFGITGRRFFIKDINGFRSYHVHIFQTGNFELKKHINFRDYMRSHPKMALEYANLKKGLAKKYTDDINSYSMGKDSFIKKIDKLAEKWRNQS